MHDYHSKILSNNCDHDFSNILNFQIHWLSSSQNSHFSYVAYDALSIVCLDIYIYHGKTLVSGENNMGVWWRFDIFHIFKIWMESINSYIIIYIQSNNSQSPEVRNQNVKSELGQLEHQGLLLWYAKISYSINASMW